MAPVAAVSQTNRPTDAEIKPAMIPAQFRGEWNSRLSACGTTDWDPLTIDAKMLYFDEYHGEVQRVVRHSKRAITVFANYSAEGHHWDRVSRVVLSGSGNALTIHAGQSIFGQYQRCPPKGAEKHRA
jgi:hypothetical protein